MADTKKEQEREELHRAIWAIAEEARERLVEEGFLFFQVNSFTRD